MGKMRLIEEEVFKLAFAIHEHAAGMCEGGDVRATVQLAMQIVARPAMDAVPLGDVLQGMIAGVASVAAMADMSPEEDDMLVEDLNRQFRLSLGESRKALRSAMQ